MAFQPCAHGELFQSSKDFYLIAARILFLYILFEDLQAPSSNYVTKSLVRRIESPAVFRVEALASNDAAEAFAADLFAFLLFRGKQLQTFVPASLLCSLKLRALKRMAHNGLYNDLNAKVSPNVCGHLLTVPSAQNRMCSNKAGFRVSRRRQGKLRIRESHLGAD